MEFIDNTEFTINAQDFIDAGIDLPETDRELQEILNWVFEYMRDDLPTYLQRASAQVRG